MVPWIQLGARLLLTVDLTVVFGQRLLGALASYTHAASEADASDTIGALTYVIMLLAGMMIWLGFKAQPVACVVTLATFTDSFKRFPFWTGSRNADFLKFHFFQSMTPVGGLLLLALRGPGKLSIDAKKSK